MTKNTQVVTAGLPGPLAKLMDKRVQFAVDVLVLVLAFQIAYLLRFEFAVPRRVLIEALHQLPLVVLLQITALGVAGVRSFIWRYIGMAEVRTFLKAACWSALPLILMRLFLPDQLQQWRVPFSVTVMDTVLAFGGVLGVRVLRRAVYERSARLQVAKVTPGRKKPVLLIGAGRAGMLAAKEIQGNGNSDLEIKAFVDDDPSNQGSVIQGIRVVGTTEQLPRLVRSLGIDHVVIALVEASRQELKRITNICERIPVKVRIIPNLSEILEGKVNVSRIRDVQIEDLLGRKPVHLDEHGVRQFLTGQIVMVTGAGGSIGSELARQVARFQPRRLLLVERAEFALFNIERELRERLPELSVQAVVADIGNEARMRGVLAVHSPHVILHAAAHKHVPMMEENPTEAITNNALATRLLAELAGEYGAESFVLISTDKAVRPRSVMGASKRVAELAIQGLNSLYPTRYVAVRFGNVIGSAGSVIPIFREQIAKGGPITVTHPDMVRYFMTIPEAAQLVLQAATMGQGGEIFILDMGEPVRILDLARDTITLSGLKPFEDIDIVFTGLRPGEKLFEELQTTGEEVAKTRHPKILIGRIAQYPEEVVRHALEQLQMLANGAHEQEICRFINTFLPEADLDDARRTARPRGGHVEEQTASARGRVITPAAAVEMQAAGRRS